MVGLSIFGIVDFSAGPYVSAIMFETPHQVNAVQLSFLSFGIRIFSVELG